MEIKKAFEQFKKELKKETGIFGGFVMNRAQIAKGTATKLVCNTISYEKEIEEVVYYDEKVQGYETWTDEEKARRHTRNLERIAYLNGEIEKYGTKTNFANDEVERIVNSKAFQKFSETAGGVKYGTEIKTEFGVDYIYLRFYY